MNEESLARANAFLAAASSGLSPGEPLAASPAEIGAKAGLEDALAIARAVRALLARRRLEAAEGGYRLLDARPLDRGEPESVRRPPRRTKQRRKTVKKREGSPTYSEVGQAVVEKLIELGREVAALRAGRDAAEEEAREATRLRGEALAREAVAAGRIRELEAKLEMAEQNLRSILIAAKGRGDHIGDSGEMQAILSVLKGAPDQPIE